MEIFVGEKRKTVLKFLLGNLGDILKLDDLGKKNKFFVQKSFGRKRQFRGKRV